MAGGEGEGGDEDGGRVEETPSHTTTIRNNELRIYKADRHISIKIKNTQFYT